MSQIALVKMPDGKWRPLSARDEKRFTKIQLRRAQMEPGECLIYTFVEPRSPRHFGFFFCKHRELFDRQEFFADSERLRDWLLVGAGYCDLFPAIDGHTVALPRSIAWELCDEQTFIEVARGIEDFMWSELAQRTLWPHLSAEERHLNVEGWHATAELNRQNALLKTKAQADADAIA